jgi:type IV pilus assembly protein PilM
MARVSVPVISIPFLNFNRPKGRIGLDIGTSSVKALMLTPQKQGGFELSFFAVEPIEGEHSKEKTVRAIKRAVEAANVKTRKLAISVAGQAVIVRQVLFPMMSGEELRSAVQYEAEKYIPFNINEVYLDARAINEKVEAGKMKILLVAARKELVDEHLANINAAGFEADAVDSDSIAVTNAFIFSNPGLSKDKTVALINIGASMTNICVLKNEILNFVRDIPIEAKNSESLETQIRLSFDYYENQFGKGIDGIYISGGGSREQGIAERMTQAFGIQTLIWDPTKNLTLAPKVNSEALKEVSSRMAVCIGLALRQ